jgi:hypothetical protein
MSDSGSYCNDFGAFDEDCDPLSPPPPPPAAPDYEEDEYDDDDYQDNDYNDSEFSYQCDASIFNSSKVSSSSSTVVERSNLMLASRREREEQLRRQLREREDRNIQPGNLSFLLRAEF